MTQQDKHHSTTTMLYSFQNQTQMTQHLQYLIITIVSTENAYRLLNILHKVK